jgi:hypothetical protein
MKTVELWDLYAAAYALAQGVPLVKVVHGGWSVFVFDDAEGRASKALGEWGSGAAMVRAKAYAGAVRQVRRLAHG